MGQDGIFLTEVKREIADVLDGTRIDKIFQPSRDESVRRGKKAAFVGAPFIAARLFYRKYARKSASAADVLHAAEKTSVRRKVFVGR